MRYGFIIYTAGDINDIVDLAVEAEAVGWDGVFYWDGIFLERHALAGDHIYDPWVVLAAIAIRTHKIRIGNVLTPLPRRRPWKVARETVSLDHLSRGRLIFPVGLGFVPDGGFSRVGEITDRKVRAELLDEGLDIVTGLWTGRPFRFQGKHFTVAEMKLLPPRVPFRSSTKCHFWAGPRPNPARASTCRLKDLTRGLKVRAHRRVARCSSGPVSNLSLAMRGAVDSLIA